MDFEQFYPLQRLLRSPPPIGGWLYAREPPPFALGTEVALIDLNAWSRIAAPGAMSKDHPFIRDNRLHAALSTNDLEDVVANLFDQLDEVEDDELLLAAVNFFVLRDAFIDLAVDRPADYLPGTGSTSS